MIVNSADTPPSPGVASLNPIGKDCMSLAQDWFEQHPPEGEVTRAKTIAAFERNLAKVIQNMLAVAKTR